MNNHVEGQNRKINTKLFNHPHIWKCLDFFIDEESKTLASVTRINANKYRFRAKNAVDSSRTIAIMGAKVKLLQGRFAKLGEDADPELVENGNLECYLLELAQKMVEFKQVVRSKTASVAAACAAVESEEEEESEDVIEKSQDQDI